VIDRLAAPGLGRVDKRDSQLGGFLIQSCFLGSSCVSRGPGGFTRKVLARSDNQGRPLGFILTGGEENVRAAEERLLVLINDVNRRSYQPFLTKLDRLREPMEDAAERVLAAIKQELDGITERLDLVADAAAEPSVEHNIVLGEDRLS
jgi:hypothetical protein